MPRSKTGVRQIISTSEYYTPKQVVRAIQDAHGIATVAAQKLGCDRYYIFQYMKRYEEVDAAYREEREKNVDFAENKQLQAMQKGERWAIENWLFCSKEGRERGWLKRAEQAQDQGLLNAIQIVMPDNRRGDAPGDAMVHIAQIGGDGEQREYSYPVTVDELKQQQRTAGLVDGHFGEPQGADVEWLAATEEEDNPQQAEA